MSPGELVSLRRESERTMTDRVQIIRPTNTADAGGMSTAYTVVATVACRVAPSQYQATERIIGGALQGTAQWRVTMPAETDVGKADLLAVGSALAGSGLTYDQVVAGGGRLMEVLGVAGPRTFELQRIVYCNELG